MSLLVGTSDRLFVARMSGRISREEVDRIVSGARDAAGRRKGTVTYVGINAPGSEPPTSEVRQYVVEQSRVLLDFVSTLEIVFEGTGIGVSLMRSAVRGMVTVARTRRGGPARTFIHSTVREALRRVAPELGAPVDVIHRDLVSLGLASPEV